MDNIFLSGGLAFLISYFSIPAIIQVATYKKLFDEPDARKVHKSVIPTLGGLGIFAGFIIATLIGTPPSATMGLQYFIAASLVIFFLGVKDDIMILSATKKLIGQLIAAGIIIKFGGIRLDNMYGFMGLHELPNTVSFILTAFTIIVVTNSFNLIDGVDGLAASLGIVTTLIFGIYFFNTGQSLYGVMSLSMAGALGGFLIYNVSPAKIFMGDTGSLMIGLVNSILVIKFINTAASSGSVLPLDSAPALGFSILMIPLFDTLRVVTIRVLHRRSPFCPDRNHIHHFLLDLGMKHTAVVATCVLGNIAFMGLAWSLRSLGPTIAMSSLCLAALVLVGIIYYNRPKLGEIVPGSILSKQHHHKVNPDRKVITISSKRVEHESSAV